MHVLMIGLGAEVLNNRAGDVRARHEQYARHCGQLTMIVSAWKREGLTATRLSNELMVYPTNSRSRLGFVWDAWVLGGRICRQQSVDLIVAQDPFSTGLVGFGLKRRFKAPLLVGNHSYFFDNPHWIAEKPLQYRFFNCLGKWLIRRADALRVVNPAEREKYLQYGIPAERVRVMPTPVPLEQFFQPQRAEQVERLRQHLKLGGRRALLWVGSLHERVKDLDTLLRAMALIVTQVPDAVLVLVGDARYSAPWRSLVRRLGVEAAVCFADRVPHAALPVYYAMAEFYIHSSRYEGLAKVMLEAAASGRAIVSTAVPGVDVVVEHGVTGLLSPVGDPATLARHGIELLQDPARARSMGECGRDLVRSRFATPAMSRAIVDLWREAASRAPS